MGEKWFETFVLDKRSIFSKINTIKCWLECLYTFFFLFSESHIVARLKQYWSLEDSFSGYLLNELTFCSTTNHSDFVYESCPLDCVKKNSAYWNAASVDFAGKTSGHVRLVLNGTRKWGAMSNTSTFFRHELSQLHASKVAKVTVYLLHSPGQDKYETCEKPRSLTVLHAMLRDKGIEYACEDNPENILFLLCFYDMRGKECEDFKVLFKQKSFNRLK